MKKKESRAWPLLSRGLEGSREGAGDKSYEHSNDAEGAVGLLCDCQGKWDTGNDSRHASTDWSDLREDQQRLHRSGTSCQNCCVKILKKAQAEEPTRSHGTKAASTGSSWHRALPL